MKLDKTVQRKCSEIYTYNINVRNSLGKNYDKNIEKLIINIDACLLIYKLALSL